MKLWNASTARSTQRSPLISRQRTEPLLSCSAGVVAVSSTGGVLASGTVSLSLLLQLAGGQDNEGLCPWVIISHRQMYVDCVAFRRKGVKPRPCTTRKL